MTGTKVPSRTARYAANVTSRDTGMVVVNACVSSDDHPKGLRGLYLLKMQGGRLTHPRKSMYEKSIKSEGLTRLHIFFHLIILFIQE